MKNGINKIKNKRSKLSRSSKRKKKKAWIRTELFFIFIFSSSTPNGNRKSLTKLENGYLICYKQRVFKFIILKKLSCFKDIEICCNHNNT